MKTCRNISLRTKNVHLMLFYSNRRRSPVSVFVSQAQQHLDLNTSARVLSKLCIPNVMTESVPNRPLDYYTCAFRKSKMSRWVNFCKQLDQITAACFAECTLFFRFLGWEDHDTYFTNTQRHRVVSNTSVTIVVYWMYQMYIWTNRLRVLFQVYEILARTAYGKRKKAEVGVDRLLNEGAYTAAFPLHEVSYF